MAGALLAEEFCRLCRTGSDSAYGSLTDLTNYLNDSFGANVRETNRNEFELEDTHAGEVHGTVDWYLDIVKTLVAECLLFRKCSSPNPSEICCACVVRRRIPYGTYGLERVRVPMAADSVDYNYRCTYVQGMYGTISRPSGTAS